MKLIYDIWKAQDPLPGNFVFLCTLKNSWLEIPLEWPISRKELSRVIKKNRDKNLYFSPNVFLSKSRKNKEVISGKYLWADLDESNPSHIWPKPTIAWQTSPGRWSSLWELSEPVDNLELTNKQLTYQVKADKGGWDLSQVLRVPGSTNYKYKSKPRGEILWTDGPKHSRVLIPDKTLRLLNSRVTLGNRSDVLWKTYKQLIIKGFSQIDVFNIVSKSQWNKFVNRPKQLKKEIEKAFNTLSHDNILTRGDQVVKKETEWLWEPYIPLRKVTLLEGDPDLGKTWLALSIARNVSLGMALPDDKKRDTGRILYMSAEDDASDTLVPRFEQLGGDLTKIAFPNKVDTISQENAFTDTIEVFKPKLIIIDPLQAYIGSDTDMHRANETREKMSLLAQICEEYNCATLVLRHLRKGGSNKSIYSGLGSIDIVAAARSALFLGRHPTEKDNRIMIHFKSNLSDRGLNLEYQLSPSFKWMGISRFSWKDAVNTDIDDKFNIMVSESLEFIEELIANHNIPIKSSWLKREAEKRNFDWEHIKRALKFKGLRRVNNNFVWRKDHE